MDRRSFIKLSALAGGGFMLSFTTQAKAQSLDSLTADAESELGNFLRITSSGDVLFHLTKHEMGQGVSTGLAMILAEELCADWQKVKITWADVDLKKFQNRQYGGYGTGGSTTISDMWSILRQAGATAKHLLVEAAANEWKTSIDLCRAENHFVVNPTTGQRKAYAELATKASQLPLPKDVKLKNESDFKLIGKPQKGKVVPAVVTGKHQYGIDVKVPGMLYAVIARCPVYKGKLKSFDATEAMKVPGVEKVVTTQAIAGTKNFFFYDIREGVAVVADSFWAAKKGKERLKIVWDEGEKGSLNIEDFEKIAEQKGLTRTDPTGFVGDDNAMADLNIVKKTVRASYVYPYQLHSFMEPLNCTAHHQGDTVEVWIGTQAPHLAIRETAKMFNVPEEKIQFHLFPSGGGFGRRWYPDAALEAICISKEAGNVPVKLLWTREDDQQTSFAHCYVRSNYQAGIDGENNLVTWYQKELRSYTWGSEVANPELTWIGYDIPHIRYDFENLLEESLVQSCAWRSVVANAWAFGQECFIDEVATTLKKDPYEFRMSLLKEGMEAEIGHQYKLSNSRLRRVLKLAAEKAGWGNSNSPGHGMGIAAYPYLHGNSYCAQVAEVILEKGKLKVERVVCAVDCGKVVNPSSVANQIEGGVIWGLTALLYGGLDIRNGRATKSNFHQNKLLRMEECPKIEVYFVESEEVLPWGVGELGPPPAVPAVINAIYAATGKRIRKLPVRVEEL